MGIDLGISVSPKRRNGPEPPSSMDRDLSWVFEKSHRWIVVVVLALLGTEDGVFERRPGRHDIAPATPEPESESRS